MYSFNGSKILSVSFKRLFGIKENISVSVCMIVGIGCVWFLVLALDG